MTRKPSRFWKMLGEETELTWRLTISGALWRLNRDPVFHKCS